MHNQGFRLRVREFVIPASMRVNNLLTIFEAIIAITEGDQRQLVRGLALLGKEMSESMGNDFDIFIEALQVLQVEQNGKESSQ
jgi:hypothetical protein